MIMQYYKIEFKINGAISFSDAFPPCFDGLLSHAYMKHIKPSALDVSDINIINVDNFENLPICKHSAGYYIASQIQYDKDSCARSFRHINSRWDNAHDYIADFGKNKATVSLIRGDFKSVQLQLQTKRIDKIWFYFASENIDFVRVLASKINSIGKKHNQMGEVESFEIAELDYNPFEAELLRPIPVNAAIEQKLTGIIKYCTYKPPYHQTQFAERCLCPKN